jgi:hypothetical protein
MSNCLFCYRPIRHQHKLPNSFSPAFKNGNRVARLPLSGYFPGHADGVLKVFSGCKRIFRTLVDDVELSHLRVLSVFVWGWRPWPRLLDQCIPRDVSGQLERELQGIATSDLLPELDPPQETRKCRSRCGEGQELEKSGPHYCAGRILRRWCMKCAKSHATSPVLQPRGAPPIKRLASSQARTARSRLSHQHTSSTLSGSSRKWPGHLMGVDAQNR